VRKQMIEIDSAQAEFCLVLAGDHLYRMDYRRFHQFHLDSEADVTIAVQPASREDASDLGILKLGADYRISRFVEKPKTEAQLAGLESIPESDRPYMASMGIYIFRTEVLKELLEAEGDDFGRDLIPAAMSTHRVMGYIFDDFWEDIGTIRRFYEVSLQLASPDPPFDFYSPERPIYTHPRFLPGSIVQGGHMHNVLMADGCRVYDATIRYSVVGLRSVVNRGVTLHRSVLMGADYYETDKDKAENRRLGRPDVGIGPGSVIEGAIIDKNARIGRRVIIRMLPNRPDQEEHNWVAKDGIVIVPKNAVLPDNTVI
jgi:glucose-1-phosphate adenylyltransferase